MKCYATLHTIRGQMQNTNNLASIFAQKFCNVHNIVNTIIMITIIKIGISVQQFI